MFNIVTFYISHRNIYFVEVNCSELIHACGIYRTLYIVYVQRVEISQIADHHSNGRKCISTFMSDKVSSRSRRNIKRRKHKIFPVDRPGIIDFLRPLPPVKSFFFPSPANRTFRILSRPQVFHRLHPHVWA